MNISLFSNERTATTHRDCAQQRAENLWMLGAKRVLELCVGPSLRTLETAYSKMGMTVSGNDIDPRWSRFHPTGSWLVGDALKIPLPTLNGFDAIVFAPPLSRGCSGTRLDALSIQQVNPTYTRFLEATAAFVGIRVLVLPGRSLATKNDRTQFHALLARLQKFEVVPLTAGARRTVKYYDVYI